MDRRGFDHNMCWDSFLQGFVEVVAGIGKGQSSLRNISEQIWACWNEGFFIRGYFQSIRVFRMTLSLLSDEPVLLVATQKRFLPIRSPALKMLEVQSCCLSDFEANIKPKPSDHPTSLG